MLDEITIQNVAVIEAATVPLDSGFTVLTGETGAGKSILIDSVNAILGSRTSRELVRGGAAKAGIWARFSSLPSSIIQHLEETGYEAEEELLLQRDISAEGKSTVRINGMPATAAILREIGGSLVNIHGQHDNQSLLNPGLHLGILDTFAGNDVLLGEYCAAWQVLTGLQKQLAALSMDEAEKTRKIDQLRYEVEEIEAARLTENEEEDLLARRTLIQNARTIVESMNTAYTALSGGDEDTGAATLLSRAADALADLTVFLPELEPQANALSDMYYAASELASEIQSRLSGYEFGDESLDDIEQRLDAIFRLKQKYGQTVAEVMAYGARAQAELDSLQSSSELIAELSKKKEQATSKAQKLASALSVSRQDAFKRLDAEIKDSLAFLNMPGIRMALQCDTVALGADGQDKLEFLIATNPGEVPKPLAKIASGGELARIMLAIKNALADKDDVPTVIYDEVDTGISGLAAGRIGQLLRNTAKGRQVLCVTHTAQVAAYAAHHLLIEKQVADGRTYTHVRRLNDEERVAELARIIAGDHVTDLALANAREMLQMAAASQQSEA